MENINSKTCIVITSIFEPTEAVIAFAAMPDLKLLVVGDKKTPLGWSHQNVEYLSVGDQEEMKFLSAGILPYNHYCRKMLGYLKAIKDGAEYIIDTDDDNIPKEGWSFPAFDDEFETIKNDLGFTNIYQLYTDKKIWPRGLPLKMINTNFDLEQQLVKASAKIGIWQGLADEDPDVDAIYRLTDDTPCYFNERPPVAIGRGTISPFNTQNTIIRKELFVLMYLPTYVTFRFTDILRGLVAQPIMWLYGFQLGFTNATVLQKRNPHDYMKDFISEVPMYEQGESVIRIVTEVISADESIENNLLKAYEKLLEKNIVVPKELETLRAWIADIKSLQS